MRGGKRLALSIGAGLALPAFAVLAFIIPAEYAAIAAVAIVLAGPCTLIGTAVYDLLGD